MGTCGVCHRRKHLTTHHKFDKRYLKAMGVISEECYRMFRAVQFKICWDCHEELNTLQSKCRIARRDCYTCKFLTMCCYGEVRRN